MNDAFLRQIFIILFAFLNIMKYLTEIKPNEQNIYNERYNSYQWLPQKIYCNYKIDITKTIENRKYICCSHIVYNVAIYSNAQDKQLTIRPFNNSLL